MILSECRRPRCVRKCFLEIFLLTTTVAVLGKLAGTAVAARLGGEPWPVALGLGALLQTKGLMEVIVLTILLDAGIISGSVFSALILMAVVSTALAMPLTRLMLAQGSRRRQVSSNGSGLPRSARGDVT